MSLSLTPSKRAHNRNQESNGKRFQMSLGLKLQKQSAKSSSGSTVFRILFPVSKIDNLTGKDDAIISKIHQETGAKVRIDEPHPGCDERVIFIMGANEDAETSEEPRKNEGELSDVDKEQNKSEEQVDTDEDKQSPPVENSESEKGASAVQKAMLLVFEKLAEGDQGLRNENEENGESTPVTLRLLVLSSQIGCLLGKGGSVIKQMSNESGAQIRVLPRDKLPSCASSSDEVVQIMGIPDSVEKAIKLISEQIIENASSDYDPTGTSPQPSGHLTSRSEAHAHTSRRFPFQGVPHRVGSRDPDFHSGMPLFPTFRESFGPNRINFPPEILYFRFLCPAERVGGLIGKGGAVIRALQHETDCDIKVIEDVPDGEDRIIVIAGHAHPDERISVVQDAVFRVLPRISKTETDNKEKVVVKLLVPSNQIGCLLGKGGAIIAEMRKVTGAYIRILGKDQIPKCASENEEVVQMNGERGMVQEALLQITTRLRHHFFRENFPSLNLPLDPPFPDPSHPPPFMGRREISPPGMFHGPPFHHFDSVGSPPHAGFHPRDDPPFMHDIRRPGIPHMPERPWRSQDLIEGGPLGSLDFIGGAPRRMGGFGGGSQPAIITNTKVEVVVPSSIVPSIYGEDGGCLKQIRKISDAQVTITDPKPGAAEIKIIISGTPEQTHAAQSLIQAFVISETETS